MRVTADLKSQPQFFSEIIAGRKTHDLRLRDRPFKVGDRFRLREWLPDQSEYTGREATVELTYITDFDSPCAYSPAALHADFCILSIRLIAVSGAPEPAANRPYGPVDTGAS